MRTFGRIAAAMVAVAALGGCASTWDVDGVASQQAQGSAFAQALHQNYVDRARFERGEADWGSTAFFVERARMAAAGQPPAPASPEEMGASGAADVLAGYRRLTTALGTTAPEMNPEACARSQAWYEHWAEQTAEGHQADHIAEARSNFETAIEDCVGEPKMAEPVAKPQSFLVHFAFDGAALLDEAMSVIERAANFFRENNARSVQVVGHTDTEGDPAYNKALSERRAEAVESALVDKGVPADSVSTKALGESMPAVDSGDSVVEQKNRRAEITVRP